MIKVRLIHYTRGSNEGIFLTLDFESPATEYIPYGYAVKSDTDLIFKIPDGFPMDTNLDRQ